VSKRSKLKPSAARLSVVPSSRNQTSSEDYPRVVGELWTARQRQLHSMHYSVSYRGSFKPELPDFLIKRYSKKGDVVFDPFSGRGTTALQANLLGRVAWASDVNPLSILISQAKLNPVGLDEVVLRLNQIDFRRPIDLHGYSDLFSPFYHPDTFRELVNLKNHIRENPDMVSKFIEMIAISRLHGHSPGFFSVYSFPDKVDYLSDNWLEFWFAGISPKSFRKNVVMASSLDEWKGFISDTLKELLRVTKKRGVCVVEVGEVEHEGKVVNLDEEVAKVAREISVPGKCFVVEELLINKQKFTKMANCFKVSNNEKGTNTNRMVVLRVTTRRR